MVCTKFHSHQGLCQIEGAFTAISGLQNKVKVPVDPTDQVMLRLKLLEALMDMSKFLLAFKKEI